MNSITIKSDKPVVIVPIDEYESMKETIEILSHHPDIITELKEERKKINSGYYTLYKDFKRKYVK
jgi:PHD/YefM family antitoxin component YafN of YafNO toxin-antitoxin module